MSESETRVSSMSAEQWVTSESPDTLAERLATDVAKLLEQALQERGEASLIVSGGSTPLPFFTALSSRELAWERVRVGLADERWVDVASPESNEKLVRENLLTGNAAAATFAGLYVDGESAESRVAAAEQRVQILRGSEARAFDIVILGMGNDAHTASLFPATEGLETALQLPNSHECQMMSPPVVDTERMTLTLAALLNTHHLFLHITGESKKTVLQQAVKANDPMTTPVVSIFQHAQPTVYWSS